MSNATLKKYYTIGEVSQQLGVPASSLRFWEKTFTNLHPTKDNKGARRYTLADIAQLQQILRLIKEQGYTLQGAQAILKQRRRKNIRSYTQEEILLKLQEVRQFFVLLQKEFNNGPAAAPITPSSD